MKCTGDNVLRITALLISVLFTGFAVVVVVQELIKPEDMLEKIVYESCNSIAVIGEDNVPFNCNQFISAVKINSEDDFHALDENCLFIPGAHRDTNKFFKRLNRHDYLKKSHYLFLSERGVLIKKSTINYEPYAKRIYQCFINDSCKMSDLSDKKISVTFSLVDEQNNHKISNSYTKMLFSQILDTGKRLFDNMLSIKKLDKKDLKLHLIFHRDYTFIEDKKPSYVTKLLKRGIDGLYLKSRGAKLRLLPWEFISHPLKNLSRIGRQYGLDKNEYEKDIAFLYILRTVQYRQFDQKMVSHLGNYYLHKKEYSTDLMLHMITQHLYDLIDDRGYFAESFNIRTGKSRSGKKRLYNQIIALEALIDRYNLGGQERLKSVINHSAQYIYNQLDNEHIVNKLLFYTVASRGKDIFYKEVNEILLKKISVISKKLLNEHVDQTFKKISLEYSGIFLRALLYANDFNVDSIKPYIQNVYIQLKSKRNIHPDKLVKTYAYLLTALADVKTGEYDNNIKQILQELKGYINDGETFIDITGGYPKGLDPSMLSTARIAKAVSYVSQKKNIQNMRMDLYNMNRYFKYLTVTSDDAVKWENASIKKKILGGVKSRPDYSTIYLSSTAETLSFFVHYKLVELING